MTRGAWRAWPQVIRRLVASGAPQLAVDVVAHVSDAADPLTPAVAHQAHAALVEALLLGEGRAPMAALKHLASLRPDDMYQAALRVLRARVPLPQAKLLLQFLTQVSATAQVSPSWMNRGGPGGHRGWPHRMWRSERSETSEQLLDGRLGPAISS